MSKHWLAVVVASSILAVFLDVSVASEEEDAVHLPRSSLLYFAMPNGNELSLRTSVISDAERTDGIDVHLVSKRAGDSRYLGTPVLWKVELSKLDHIPKETQYALAKIADDDVLIFFPWNNHFWRLDLKSGKILEKGQGNSCLLRSIEFTPMQLWVRTPQSGREMTEQEMRDAEAREKAERKTENK